ncbi:hypothetical protein [Georgenia sp. AZ-5]|uniref:hypothetical protein n=1 Tax=Georgenia sp. AZ-5 TaxID=3367526 RepID=UPI003753ECC0
MREITPSEIDGQALELLPPRETLDTYVNWADVEAFNVAAAANIESEDATANALALQLIGVFQTQ